MFIFKCSRRFHSCTDNIYNRFIKVASHAPYMHAIFIGPAGFVLLPNFFNFSWKREEKYKIYIFASEQQIGENNLSTHLSTDLTKSHEFESDYSWKYYVLDVRPDLQFETIDRSSTVLQEMLYIEPFRVGPVHCTAHVGINEAIQLCKFGQL